MVNDREFRKQLALMQVAVAAGYLRRRFTVTPSLGDAVIEALAGAIGFVMGFCAAAAALVAWAAITSYYGGSHV